MTNMNLSVLQKMIEYRRTMLCESSCFDSQTIAHILLHVVGTKPREDPYQQFMNVYRQNLFQAADESVRTSRRRRAFVTLQRLNQEMDARVSRHHASTTTTTNAPIPAPTSSTGTPCPHKSRDEPSMVSLEATDDVRKENTIIHPARNDIPQSVMMRMMHHCKPARRVSLPRVVDCCDEGVL